VGTQVHPCHLALVSIVRATACLFSRCCAMLITSFQKMARKKVGKSYQIWLMYGLEKSWYIGSDLIDKIATEWCRVTLHHIINYIVLGGKHI
jgi:hypothetical protein